MTKYHVVARTACPIGWVDQCPAENPNRMTTDSSDSELPRVSNSTVVALENGCVKHASGRSGLWIGVANDACHARTHARASAQCANFGMHGMENSTKVELILMRVTLGTRAVRREA